MNSELSAAGFLRHNRRAVVSAGFLAGILLMVIAWPAVLKLARYAGSSGVVFTL